jgi:hypothetical protein
MAYEAVFPEPTTAAGGEAATVKLGFAVLGAAVTEI